LLSPIKSDLEKWLVAYLKDHESAFSKYLKDNYTDRSGFYSSHPNYIEGWKEKTDNWTKLDGHYLGALLEFFCQEEGIEEYSICEDVQGNGGNISLYMKLKTEV